MGRSAARQNFDNSWAIVDELIDLRNSTGVTTHDQRSALNRSAMVFVVTAWEAYIEDLAVEAGNHMADHCPTFAALPRALKNEISQGIMNKPLKWSVPDVVDDNWRKILKKNTKELVTGSKFNTPKSDQVSELLKKTVGFDDIASKWSWQRFSAPGPADRLNETVVIRGEIVHTSRKPKGLNKQWIVTYGGNIQKLVERTDTVILDHVEKYTGVLFPSRP